MGYLINPDGCIYEASISDGYLYVHHLDKVILKVSLPIPKHIVCKRQRNIFKSYCTTVVGLLKNEDYNIVFRMNGEIDLLTKQYHYVAGFKYEYIPEPCALIKAGAIRSRHHTTPCIMQVTLSGEYTLFSEGGYIVIHLDSDDLTCKHLIKFVEKKDCLQFPMMELNRYKSKYISVDYDFAKEEIKKCSILIGDVYEDTSIL